MDGEVNLWGSQSRNGKVISWASICGSIDKRCDQSMLLWLDSVHEIFLNFDKKMCLQGV